MKSTSNSQVKRKGIFRWGAIGPFAITAGLMVAYFTLFFDLHLRRGMEKAASLANGAKVDIGAVKTSFLSGLIRVSKIEVGNPSVPMKNRFEIAEAVFSLRLLPLLEKKVVVKEAKVSDIRYGTERKYSAEMPVVSSQGNGTLVSKVQSGFDKALRSKVGEKEVENLVQLLSGKNVQNQVISIGEGSNSFAQVKKIESNLTTKSTELNDKMKALPPENAVSSVRSRIDAIGAKKVQNVEDAGKLLGEVSALSKDVSEYISKAKDAASSAEQAVQMSSAAVGQMQSAVDEDVAYIKRKMQLPQMGLKDLTLPLLGPKLGSTIEKATRYAELARKYMPAKTKKQDEPVAIEERGRGKTFHFGRKGSYPSFLLEQALISSAVSEDAAQGDVKGLVLGVNTQPAIYGKPTSAKLTANFAPAKVEGAELALLVDHVTEKQVEQATVSVQKFPVEQWVLSEDPAFFIEAQKAQGTGSLVIKFEDDSLVADMQANLKEVKYRVASPETVALGILSRATENFSSLQLSAKVISKAGNFDVSMKSDLGERLGQAVEKEVRAQLEALEKKIRADVEKAVSEKKKELSKKIDKWKQENIVPLEARLKPILALGEQLEQQTKRIEQEKDKLLKGKAEEELNKLKNNIKLPGF